MPIAKTQNLEQVARWFHALSDETRLRIIECLGEGEQCVCDLMAMLDTAQSRLSFHLKTLKDAGLLNDRREGRWMYYSLNAHMLEELQDVMAGLKKTGSTRKPARSCE
jgi:ArsR family transcriptional regulator, arsenate/arsenite/antimonite-responsive transcriptional repressor